MLASMLAPLPTLKVNASVPSLTTTLKDGMTVRSDKLTFNVWAKNGAGKKIASTVTFNGKRLAPIWDDSDKTTYSLSFEVDGEYTVVVSASSDGGRKKQLTYHINYISANDGDVIGNAVWSVEIFTVGCGYLVEPVSFPILAGESAAGGLIRLLHENGLACYYGGSVNSAFYLAYIADGEASAENYNGYKKSGTAKDPVKLGISPSIPDYLQEKLRSSMDFFDPLDYQKNWTGYLGEFVFSSGSGWMYCVNNNFPNVGFSDMYLSDGDVIRVQFTLGYGADIGGMSALGGQVPGVDSQPQSEYYHAANKDALTEAMANARASGLLTNGSVKLAYENAASAAARLDAPQTDVDRATAALLEVLSNPDPGHTQTDGRDETDADGESGTEPDHETRPDVPSKPDTAPSGTETEADTTEPPAETEGGQTTDTSHASPGGEGSSGTADGAPDSPFEIAREIIEWKKKILGFSEDGFLLDGAFPELAGTTAGDWYPIGLSRLGVDDNYNGYLAVLRDRVEERYRQSGRLSTAKATEWHRITLAVLAAGGDPTRFGTDENGQPIDLIADGTYDRGKTAPLGRQGINGWIWGLIALDSMRYEVPDDAFYTRDDIIREILSMQLADGGWALSGSISDPDLTAMAVEALSPYYKIGKIYKYQRKSQSFKTESTVMQSIDEALACLSSMQLDGGDFMSWGTENVESTDQVMIALCCLGIDPLKDERFIKNGHTLLDGVLKYRRPDGGFAHSFDYDPDNPNAVPGESNSMAGEQTLLAMAALWRQANGMRTIYDFRPEENDVENDRAVFSEADMQKVDSLPESVTTEHYVTVTELLDKLENSADFEGKEAYLQKLRTCKTRIAEIEAEIDDLNAEILDKLYPFENISIRDKNTVDSIIERYTALSEYDRAKVSHWEDVIKAKTQVDTQLRGLVIFIVLVVVAAALAFFLILSVRKKKRLKERLMEELAAQFEGEEE